MRSTRDNVLLLATRARAFAPVDVDRHHDFDAEAVYRVQRGIDSCGARAGDALLIDEGAPVQAMRLGDLCAWLRGHALDKLALKVERAPTLPGEIVALIIGDESARVRVLKLTPDPSVPACAALKEQRQ